MRETTTKKQQELLNYVINFIEENKYKPSYREIMRALDYKSVSTVAIHVNNLINEGYLKKEGTSHRSLEVVGYDGKKEKNGNVSIDKYQKMLDIENAENQKVLVKAAKILGIDKQLKMPE
jgi:repressor LexA